MSTFDDFAKSQADQDLDPATQARHIAYLRSLPAGGPAETVGAARRLRPRLIIAALTAGVLIAAGGGTAVAFVFFSNASDTSTGYCYATATLDESSNNRTEFAAAGTEINPNNAAVVSLEVCEAYWRSGVFAGGTVDVSQPPAGGAWPVPPLVACVLPSGKAAVFPGDPTTCRTLGLSSLDPEL